MNIFVFNVVTLCREVSTAEQFWQESGFLFDEIVLLDEIDFILLLFFDSKGDWYIFSFEIIVDEDIFVSVGLLILEFAFYCAVKALSK